LIEGILLRWGDLSRTPSINVLGHIMLKQNTSIEVFASRILIVYTFQEQLQSVHFKFWGQYCIHPNITMKANWHLYSSKALHLIYHVPMLLSQAYWWMYSENCHPSMTIIAHDSPQKAFVMHAYPGKKVGSEPHVLGLLSYYLFLLHPLPCYTLKRIPWILNLLILWNLV